MFGQRRQQSTRVRQSLRAEPETTGRPRGSHTLPTHCAAHVSPVYELYLSQSHHRHAEQVVTRRRTMYNNIILFPPESESLFFALRARHKCTWPQLDYSTRLWDSPLPDVPACAWLGFFARGFRLRVGRYWLMTSLVTSSSSWICSCMISSTTCA